MNHGLDTVTLRRSLLLNRVVPAKLKALGSQVCFSVDYSGSAAKQVVQSEQRIKALVESLGSEESIGHCSFSLWAGWGRR